MQCENHLECPIECSAKIPHERNADCDDACKNLYNEDVYCLGVSCGCYLCNDVTQHDQDMEYICDECKEEQ